MPRFKRVQRLIDKINGVTRENLTGIRVVRAFNAEKYQENKFEEVNTALTNQQLFNQKAFSVLQPVMYLIMYFLTLTIYFVGAYIINDAIGLEKLSLFGDIVAFITYVRLFTSPLSQIAQAMTQLQSTAAASERVFEFLDEEEMKDEKDILMEQKGFYAELYNSQFEL